MLENHTKTYGFGHDELIGSLMKVKLPFEPSSIAQLAALASLDDNDFLTKTIKNNVVGMQVHPSLKPEKPAILENDPSSIATSLAPSIS